MAKLWDKGYELDRLIEAFTVGDDWLVDRRLVAADCVASMAHAAMLGRIGILQPGEVASLHRELAAIIEEAASGRFAIARSDEDCHTAIENRLTAALGDVGKKIHTGRSRNDQVMGALRLWIRGFLFAFVAECLALAETLIRFADRHADVPMPGRTHLQPAMPSSVGLWAAAHAEEIIEELPLVRAVFDFADSCPLGSAASYGVPLPLDREMVAELLGFSRVQNNVLWAHNSRGKIEAIVLGAVEQVCLGISRIAEDLLIFTLPEFGWFSLPRELTSGSSIMPQKRNPDGLELLRAQSAAVSADAHAVSGIMRGLPSGYNRDAQLTKGPLFRGCETGLSCVRVANLTVSRLQVHRDRLRSGFTPEIWATDRALELVAGGMPFRDAYRQAAAELPSLSSRDPSEGIRNRTSTGTAGNLRLEVARSEAEKLSCWLASARSRSDVRLRELAGRDVVLFQDPLS